MQMHCLFWAVHMGITLGRGRGQQREYFQQKSRRGRAIFCKIRGGGAGEEVILLPKKKTHYMEITIEITRQTVFSQVARRTEWQGTRAPEDRDYARLTLSEADASLFNSFFDEAAMHLIDICRQFLLRVSNTDDSLKITLMQPTGSDHSGLEKTAENLLTSHVLGLWQEIVAPGRAAATFARRDDYALKMQSIIYHHTAPKRLI